jgi:alanine-synthesizing transaminase
MFSRRLHWDLAPNRLSRALEENRRAGRAILDLTESNPTRAGLAYPAEDILAALADGRTLDYEPSPAGSPAARQAVSEYYAARGLVAEPDCIILTASTSEAYAWLFKLLAGAGEQVLVPRPSYPLFEFLAKLELVEVVQYPLVYDGGWSIDLDALTGAVTERTRAIVLVNPNNPTGSFVKRAELEKVAALGAARGIALIADEVFADYAFGQDAARVTSLTGVDHALTFCLSGLSKVAGLPQMKLGWIVTGGPRPLRAQALERLELIADTYLSVGAAVQHALPRLLAAGGELRRQIAARVAVNLDHLREVLKQNRAAELLRAEGGWYATLRVPRTRSEEEWCLELIEHDCVLVQPGFFYDFESEAFLVLSLLTPPETFREGVERLAARL